MTLDIFIENISFNLSGI